MSRPGQRVIVGGCLLGFVVLGFGRPVHASPTATLSESPALISANPFPVSVAVGGLTPGTSYVYTLRLRQASSTFDYGSFWSGSAFTTSYSPAGVADASGGLTIRAVLKPGTAIVVTGLRFRIKQAAGSTPAPIDLTFAPAMVSGSISGQAYHAGLPVTEGEVELVDEAGTVLSRTGVGSSSVNPWSAEPGFYSLPAALGTYRIRLIDPAGATLFESSDVVVGSDPVALDLDPPPPLVYSPDLFLSELFPDPIGDDGLGECIELENRGDAPADLGGWKLSDAGGGEYVFAVGTTIGGHSLLCVTYATSHLSLNNGGDTITLIDPAGTSRDQTVYAEAGEGESWAWDPAVAGWRWSLQPTPGAVNAFPLPPEPPLLVVDEVKVSTDEVRVRGVVTVASGTLGEKLAYIQDETGGVQVYGSADLALGTLVELLGRISSYHNERRFKFTVATVLGAGALPSPARPDGLPDEALEGRLVTYTGRITRIRGSTIWIGARSGEVKVVFRSSLGWKRPKLKTGDLVRVQGIVGQYSDLDEQTEGYRVLPRLESDFEILEAYVKPKRAKREGAPLVKVAQASPALTAGRHTELVRTTSYPGRDAGLLLELLGLVVWLGGGVRALRKRDPGRD